MVHSIDAAAGWRVALRELAGQSPPGGSASDLDRHLERLMLANPDAFLSTTTRLGPDDATVVFRAATPGQHRRLALAEHHARLARRSGALCVQALQRIGQMNDRPTHAALSSFLAGDLVEEDVAERFARALELFWADEFDESAHVLVPRIECVLRGAAHRLGIQVVWQPRPDKEVGGVEALGALLRELGGLAACSWFVNAGWHAYLVNLLTDPLGLNLRNRISHGLHGNVDSIDAALLVQASLFLAETSIDQLAGDDRA